MDTRSTDHRAMPLIARRFVLHLVDECKRRHLAAGNRAAAETLDAVAAQVDPDRLAGSLRTFDALQRSARALGGPPPRAKPAFRTMAEKNRWERNEELRVARHFRAQATRVR